MFTTFVLQVFITGCVQARSYLYAKYAAAYTLSKKACKDRLRNWTYYVKKVFL